MAENQPNFVINRVYFILSNIDVPLAGVQCAGYGQIH